MEKLIIDREAWLRGEGSENSQLIRRSDNKMCCLGFLGIQCGNTPEQLVGMETPLEANTTTKALFPPWLLEADTVKQDFYPDDHIVPDLMTTNDNQDLTDDERETRLTALFLEKGIQLEFIN